MDRAMIAHYIMNMIPLTKYPYKGENISCPVCCENGIPIADRDRRFKSLDTSLCPHCGLFFTNPMPTESELEAYYRDMYRFDYQLAASRPPSGHTQKKYAEAKRRLKTLNSIIEPRRELRLLDFGCGAGELVRAATKLGIEAHGFEPGTVYARASQDANSTNVRHARWQDVHYQDGYFDVITCLHVLEHLRAPRDSLLRMHQWLQPDGHLWVEVPNMQGYSYKGFEHFHFAHVLGFSQANLILLAFNCGFFPAHIIDSTSIVFRKKRDHDRLDVDLARTAARNRLDYGKPFSLRAYASFHVRRICGRVLRQLRPV